MNNITDIDKFKQDKEREELKKLATPMGEGLAANISFLITLGWDVRLTEEIDRLTSYVDYKNKKLITNTSNVVYAYDFFHRVRQNCGIHIQENQIDCCYKYTFEAGEEFLKSDGTTLCHLYMAITDCTEFPDVKNYETDFEITVK